MQNRTPGGSSAWQLEQRIVSEDPQLVQNLALFGFSVWQWGQIIEKASRLHNFSTGRLNSSHQTLIR
jgi:hypothetical protein